MSLKKILVCVVVFGVLRVQSLEIKPLIDSYDEYKDEIDTSYGTFVPETRTGRVRSTVFQTINKYYCSLDSIIEGSHLIIYGNKAWSFPVQDVNLTLGYPPADSPSLDGDLNEYYITGFKVILHIDGTGSKGYITSGGVLQETISLSFVSPRISQLRYHFWLYGARKDTTKVNIELNNHRLC